MRHERNSAWSGCGIIARRPFSGFVPQSRAEADLLAPYANIERERQRGQNCMLKLQYCMPRRIKFLCTLERARYVSGRWPQKNSTSVGSPSCGKRALMMESQKAKAVRPQVPTGQPATTESGNWIFGPNAKFIRWWQAWVILPLSTPCKWLLSLICHSGANGYGCTTSNQPNVGSRGQRPRCPMRPPERKEVRIPRCQWQGYRLCW